MFPIYTGVLRTTLGIMIAAMVAVTGPMALAKSAKSERYVPAIWVDPDGCEHWVMDDGWEGYMTPHVTRDGIPVCHRVNACMVISSDQLFATAKHFINPSNRKRLEKFFKTAGASAYSIYGHTDSRGSDAYNIGLSNRRANAVAQIAKGAGAHLSSIRGFGERQPIATNATSRGMKLNRRVEIICIK